MALDRSRGAYLKWENCEVWLRYEVVFFTIELW